MDIAILIGVLMLIGFDVVWALDQRSARRQKKEDRKLEREQRDAQRSRAREQLRREALMREVERYDGTATK